MGKGTQCSYRYNIQIKCSKLCYTAYTQNRNTIATSINATMAGIRRCGTLPPRIHDGTDTFCQLLAFYELHGRMIERTDIRCRYSTKIKTLFFGSK